MSNAKKPENIKICPACGTNLSLVARRCAVCGYGFTEEECSPPKETRASPEQNRYMLLTVNLPALLGLIIMILAINVLVILGLRNREENRDLVASNQATATYNATIYVSPTVEPTATFTPGPPTSTPLVEIDYEVLPGDSCLSIADHFNIFLDALLSKNNDVDCANLQVGTVLRIPPSIPTAEPTLTPTAAVP